MNGAQTRQGPGRHARRLRPRRFTGQTKVRCLPKRLLLPAVFIASILLVQNPNAFGQAQGPSGTIQTSVPSLDFGSVALGTPAQSLTLLVGNSGTTPLNIYSDGVSGAGYTLVSETCSGTTIPPNTANACQIVVSFAPQLPGTQTGTLSIVSSSASGGSIALTGSGVTNSSAPVIAALDANTLPLAPVTGYSFTVIGANFSPGSVVYLGSSPASTQFVDANHLVTGYPSFAINTLGQVPVTVGDANNTALSNVAILTPYWIVNTQAGGLAVANGTLYAISTVNGSTNNVIPINPATGALGTSISVGNAPSLITASTDGSYLFVANSGDYTISRINVAAQEVDRTFPYAPNLDCGTCGIVPATDLQPVAGSPTEVLLAQGGSLALYNDSGMVNQVPSTANYLAEPMFDSIALAGSPLTIYGLPFTDVMDSYFQVVDLTPSGLEYTQVTGTNYGGNNTTGAQVVSDGSLLYTSAGQVWNPATGGWLGNFPVSLINITSYPNMRELTADPALGQLYSIGMVISGGGVLTIYDDSVRAQIGQLAFPLMTYPYIGDTVRWGANGLAFVGPGPGLADQEVYILSSHQIASPSATNPQPVTTSLSPPSTIATSPAFQLAVNGSGFGVSSLVEWNGSPLTTTFVNSQQLTAVVPTNLLATAGTVPITVVSPAPGGGTSAPQNFTVQSVATTTVLTATPSSVELGSNITLTATVTPVAGSGTPTGTVSFFNGSTQIGANYGLGGGVATEVVNSLPVGSATLTATYSAANPYTGSTSTGVSVTITAPPVIPSIASLSPAYAGAAGAAFTLTVNGSNFTSNAAIDWNGTALSTQFVTSTQLTAQVPASNIITSGNFAVTVVNLGSSGGTSGTLQFAVVSASSQGAAAPSFQPDSVSIAQGSSGSLAVTISSAASDVTASCLNLPTDATCSYSAGTLTISTASTTPKGTYQVTVIFTETLQGAAAAFLIPIAMLPLVLRRRHMRKWAVSILAILTFAVLVANFTACGGGGSSTTPPPPQTHTATAAGGITVTVQ
jgi:hypothetical protein